MIIARVIGTLVATVKTKTHENFKIIVVRPIGVDGQFNGDSFNALDVSQSGIGDSVLIIREGTSISIIMNVENAAVDALAIGVIDYITANGKQRTLSEKYEMK